MKHIITSSRIQLSILICFFNLLSISQIRASDTVKLYDDDTTSSSSRTTNQHSGNETIPSSIPKNQQFENRKTVPPKRHIPNENDEMEEFKRERLRRMKERREKIEEKARVKMIEMIENPQNFMSDKAELMNEEQISSLREEAKINDPTLEKKQHRWLRNRKNSYEGNPNLADPGEYYSEWAQAYRMLGAMISCDSGGVGYYGGKNYQGCSRYIMWAAVSDNMAIYFT